MKPLFSHWDEVRRVLELPGKVLWLFDFDGTLVPIARHPQQVVLPSGTRQLLKKLAERYPGRVGILSGRSLMQVRRRVRIRNLIYGGDHGYEIQAPGLQWHYPLTANRQKQLRLLARRIRREMPSIPGLWVEDKSWTLCIHYREARPHDMTRIKSILHRICNQVPALGFIVQKGLKTVEILSDVHWNKGQAVRWLKRHLHASRVFYAGDDTTDETVFRLLGRKDVSVHVGQPGRSRASYYVPQEAVSPKLLQRILSL